MARFTTPEDANSPVDDSMMEEEEPTGAASDSDSSSSESDSDSSSDSDSGSDNPHTAKRRKLADMPTVTTLELTEEFDPVVAHWIIRHLTTEHLSAWEGTRQGFEWDGTKQSYVDAVKRAMKKHVKNKGVVKYKLGKNTAEAGAGRLNAPPAQGLQNMCRGIRALMAGGRYFDLDFENCQLVIAEQLARQKGWACPALSAYNADRSSKLAEAMTAMGCDRAKAKGAIIALTMGLGKKKTEASGLPAFFVKELQPELARLRKLIAHDAEYGTIGTRLEKALKKEGKGRTVERSLPSIVLQTYENRCALAMIQALQDSGRTVGALIHDSCTPRKLSQDETELPAELKRKVEEAVFAATGFKLHVECKPMEESIVPPPEELAAVRARLGMQAPAVKDELKLDAAQKAVMAAELSVPPAAIGEEVERSMREDGCGEAVVTIHQRRCPRTGLEHDADANTSVRVTTGGFATLRCGADGACKGYVSPTFIVSHDIETALLGSAEPRMLIIAPYDVVIDDVFGARALVRLLPGRLVKDSGVVWAYDETCGMWGHDEALLHAVITRLGARLKFMDTRMKEVLQNFSGSSRDTTAMLSKLPSVLPAHDGYFYARRATSRGKLLFPQGIFDFEEDTLTPGFDPSIVFQAVVASPFPRARNEDDVQWLRRELFYNSFEDAGITTKGATRCPSGERLLHNLMRAALGHIERKVALLGTGLRNSGKSMIAKVFIAFFGTVIAYSFDPNNLLVQTFQGEPARENMAAIPLGRARFAFLEEMRDTAASTASRVILDASKMKKWFLTGGTTFPARLMRANEYPVYPTATAFMLSNNIPEFPADPSVLEKFQVIKYGVSYVEHPLVRSDRWEGRADHGIEAKVTSARMAAALFHILRTEYKRWKASGFAELEADATQSALLQELVPVTTVAALFEGTYTITGNTGDSVGTTELQKFLKQRGYSGPASQMRKELKDLLGEPAQRAGVGGKIHRYFGIKKTPPWEVQLTGVEVEAGETAEALLLPREDLSIRDDLHGAEPIAPTASSTPRIVASDDGPE